jgi:cell division transport system ATP-binding protein
MKLLFKKVGKVYGQQQVLEEISFLIKPGEFVFITGPSGAGKSTILKIILGATFATSGRVKAGELVINRKTKPKELFLNRRKIGVIFQDFQLIDECTVEENVGAPLDIIFVKGEEKSARVGEVLEKTGITGKKDLFPSQLSGGELQRVCLARALVVNPEILLADEPTGNLDPKTSWEIMGLLKKINQEGTTVIMATHNTDIVDSMAKRVIKINEGKLVSDKAKARYEDK